MTIGSAAFLLPTNRAPGTQAAATASLDNGALGI
jgi:hypothetical protein